MSDDKPCEQCRREVDHLVALDIAITGLRSKARFHRGARVDLIHFVKAARKVARGHRRHRREDHLEQHRAAIRSLAQHLTDHAEGRAA